MSRSIQELDLRTGRQKKDGFIVGLVFGSPIIALFVLMIAEAIYPIF